MGSRGETVRDGAVRDHAVRDNAVRDEAVKMSSDRMIRRIDDPGEQEKATLRYWHSLPMGERLTAVWDASEAAYSFAAAFKGGAPGHDAHRLERTLTRVQRPRG